jgi:hypothetical protein
MFLLEVYIYQSMCAMYANTHLLGCIQKYYRFLMLIYNLNQILIQTAHTTEREKCFIMLSSACILLRSKHE